MRKEQNCPDLPNGKSGNCCINVAILVMVYKGTRARSGVQKHLFVVSRSDMYIVSIQQTVHSALSRGFESCSAPESMKIIKALGCRDKLSQTNLKENLNDLL